MRTLTGQRSAGSTDLRIAVALGLSTALAVIAAMPYLMQLMPALIARVPVSMPLFIAIQSTQAAVLCAALAWAGLRMGRVVGLDARWLRHWLGGATRPLHGALHTWQSIAIGAVVAIALLLLASAIDPLLPQMRHAPAAVDPWLAARNGLLASLYGGIVEEILMRLFLVTLVVWLFARMRHRAPTNGVYPAAIVVAAVVFGVGHLPAASEIWPLDAIVISRTLLLNAIGGVVFGWLYWKRGLEMAIVAHASTDVVVHSAMPLIRMAVT